VYTMTVQGTDEIVYKMVAIVRILVQVRLFVSTLLFGYAAGVVAARSK
jgi:hypothetical protein